MVVGGLRRIARLEQRAVVERINVSVFLDYGPCPQVGFVGDALELTGRERTVSRQRTRRVRPVSKQIFCKATV